MAFRACKPICFLPNWAHELGFQKQSYSDFSEIWGIENIVSVSFRWTNCYNGGIDVTTTWFILGCAIDGDMTHSACKAIIRLAKQVKK